MVTYFNIVLCPAYHKAKLCFYETAHSRFSLAISLGVAFEVVSFDEVAHLPVSR
jgi:hypothetical protein